MRAAEKMRPTIVAIATAAGEGGIGIVRLSGERALEIAGLIFRARSGKPVSSQKSFTVRYGHAIEAGSGVVIDEGLLTLMRGPKSYTGEDVAEISLHGGPAVLQAVVRRALEEGAQWAEPGEFTKRAFLSGRIDLLQAEAVLDLVHAKTERVRDWAASQLGGELSAKMRGWKKVLLEQLAHLEAQIDFPEDEPDTAPNSAVAAVLEDAASHMRALLHDSELAFVARRGFTVVLCGRPNVGKSSLLNRLTRTDRVIVTPYPGTTRDVVEAEASVEGWPVRFVDTAGVHEAEHPIEKEGIERSKKALKGADLILLIVDGSETTRADELQWMKELAPKRGVLVLNKSDLPGKVRTDAITDVTGWPQVPASAVRDGGTALLESTIARMISQGRLETPGEALLSSARQKVLLENVSKDLERAAVSLKEGRSVEFASADIRLALDGLGEMVGEIVNEDMLDILFSQFCIGK